MILAEDAVATARALIGTPYSEMDCIALIRAVIRRAAGGVKNYRCEGTNWLWASIGNSGKYRHLTWRQEGIAAAAGEACLPAAGMLAFKRNGGDVHHVGLVTGEGTVIHSSSVKGEVVETALSEEEGWTLLAIHRYIEADEPVRAKTPAGLAQETESAARTTMLMREDGILIELTGRWRVATD